MLSHHLSPSALALLLAGAACSPGLEPVGLDPNPNAIAAVAIEPDSALVFPLDTVRFRAVAVLASGARRPADGAQFTATGGAIDGFGLYVAADTGDQTIRVRVNQGSQELVALARVNVKKKPPQLVGVELSPDSAMVVPGASLQMSVLGRRSDGSTVSVNGAFGATGGTITPAGLYSAGLAGGLYRIWFRETTRGLVDSSRAFIDAPAAPPPPPPPPPAPGPLGPNADLVPRRLFPADNPWNQPVDTAQVDPNSAAIISNIGATKAFHPDFGANWNGGPFGIPYVVVSGTQAPVPVTFDYADESDPGPYPIPANAPIEGGASSTGDRHVLIVDRDAWKLYELYAAYPQANGSWHAGSGAIFDLNSNALRPAGWTSADAAGLPVLAGLVRYDEVAAGEITHALRFTVSITRRAYLYPARHWASSNTSTLRPPMGMRVRLKASFDISGYPARMQVILRALRKYGMIVADNGSDWFISGVADARWNDTEVNTLKQLRGSDFEVIRMVGVVTP